MEGLGIDFSINDENKTIEMVVNLGNKIDTLQDLINTLQENKDILDYTITDIKIEG